MSVLVNDATRAVGDAAGTRPSTAGAAIVIVFLFLVLMTQREVARPLLTEERARRAASLKFVLLPVGLAFVVLIAVRIGDLLT